MRVWCIVSVIVCVACVTTGHAQPAPSSNAEIAKLDDELRKHEAARDVPAQERTSRKLVAEQRKLSGNDSVYTWRRELALMALLQNSGNQTAALELLKTMLAKAERLHGKESSEVRDVIGWMIASYQLARTFDDELDRLFQRLLAVSKKLHGDKGVLYASDLGRYGDNLFSRSEYVAAQRVMEQALKIEEAANANVAGRLSTLGLVYMQTDHARAKSTFDRYLGLQRSQPVE